MWEECVVNVLLLDLVWGITVEQLSSASQGLQEPGRARVEGEHKSQSDNNEKIGTFWPLIWFSLT